MRCTGGFCLPLPEELPAVVEELQVEELVEQALELLADLEAARCGRC